MSTLLEIGQDVLTLQHLIEQADAELTSEIEAALDNWFKEVGDKQAQKVDNYVALYRSLELRASVRKAEMDRLALLVAHDTNAAKRLKQRLQMFMEMTNQKRIDTPRYEVSTRTNGGKLPVKVTCDAEQLPPSYQRTTVTADLDKIREDLVAGKRIGGCQLGERGTHLVIA